MDSLMDYLDMLEDILDNSKTVPFSNKISVDKERIFDIIGEIRMNVPNEIRQAQRMIEDHDKIINDAKSRATNIIKEAQSKAQELTDEHEIYKMSMEQAREIVEEAKRNAKDIRLNAMDYTDEILSRAEETIRDTITELDRTYRAIEDDFTKTIDVIYNSRQQLRGNKA